MTSRGADTTTSPPSPAADAPALSHNLLGQRLGPKGRGTRERILAATERLLVEARDTPISLSAVAREASLSMTTLYLYFSDFSELLLAVLDPIVASAEESYLGAMRLRWPDDAVAANCTVFVTAFQAFWVRHSRILHLRNSHASDRRIMRHSIVSALPLIDLLLLQMDADRNVRGTLHSGMATALVTGIERLSTVTTDVGIARAMDHPRSTLPSLLRGQARLLELGIIDGRQHSSGIPIAAAG